MALHLQRRWKGEFSITTKNFQPPLGVSTRGPGEIAALWSVWDAHFVFTLKVKLEAQNLLDFAKKIKKG